MYEDRYQPYPPPYAVPDPDDDHRLRHLVLVDGRVVDTWTERVEGTPWQIHADRFDRDVLHSAPTLPAPAPLHERVLLWLDAVCGGRAAVTALDTEPLEDHDDLPEVVDREVRDRLAETADLLDGVAAACFEPGEGHEFGVALRTALVAVWTADPDLVDRARSARDVAGSVSWVVGKANGVFRPVGELRVGRLSEVLGTTTSPASRRYRVELALRGLSPAIEAWERPGIAPNLLALGRTDLLISSTRIRLARLRTQALAAQAQATGA
ncbi:hypothetical protein NSZ01_12410 [Nocardioides szechwanensis]|uniref:Uncharacterized protein n=1 Tax=Nocardioides szechwanensis TaxID=1005944 RepID=A0A1H0CCB7_9ACTN|nr:hypothetical protein [Nocardioides szechwanensis]GEP33473.1 hypothetical protein NSZ01_12410 [Nocardioides szechwanensis]SDN55453.1 hypothetical protein SAMN05192576_2381 [Nocardioides szechwanensis]